MEAKCIFCNVTVIATGASTDSGGMCCSMEECLVQLRQQQHTIEQRRMVGQLAIRESQALLLTGSLDALSEEPNLRLYQLEQVLGMR